MATQRYNANVFLGRGCDFFYSEHIVIEAILTECEGGEEKKESCVGREEHGSAGLVSHHEGLLRDLGMGWCF